MMLAVIVFLILNIHHGLTEPRGNLISNKNQIGRINLKLTKKARSPEKFIPGDSAQPFTLPSLRGRVNYPGVTLNRSTPMLFHLYDPNSGFARCLWNCSGSLEELIMFSPNNTHYLFMSLTSSSSVAYENANWMYKRFRLTSKTNATLNKKFNLLINRLHFISSPINEVTKWLSGVFTEWSCNDHNCGVSTAVFSTKSKNIVLRRLDGRYDWVSSPKIVFGNKTMAVVNSNDGCSPSSAVKQMIALVKDGGCSYFRKAITMESSGAIGLIVMTNRGESVKDMNCDGSECSTPVSIPVTMVQHNDFITNVPDGLKVKFQDDSSGPGYFMGVHQGRLAEVGWFLYPTFRFLTWQSQWFNFKTNLNQKMQEPALTVKVFKNATMHGSPGVLSTITMPPLEEMRKYESIHLDMSLSCPGTRDQDCPAWDHTINLYVCCDKSSPLCNMELGRWISPFRRRIGRWLTDITAYLPMFSQRTCTFNMKTVPWAAEWRPSLNIRFTHANNNRAIGSFPKMMKILYEPGATFDKNYNSHFKPISILMPNNLIKAQIVSVITGHGSDENGCGEFCVTSHHFVVNQKAHNRTFSIAGSPLGCADRVPAGVEPNEHGTWLYGRNGWCDGQQVEPWLIDVTSDVTRGRSANISYYGWFRGKTPDPKRSPGNIILYSYLVLYY